MSMTTNNSLKNKCLLYFFMVVLTLTTFPLAQGWLGTGDFIPRAVLILITLLIFPRLLFNKDIFLLLVFFAYVYIVSPHIELIPFLANLMEFVIPLVIAHFIIDNKNNDAAIILSKFVIIITTVNMLLTILANIQSPNIVRQMVAYTYQGDEIKALFYRKHGVCNYSFALIIMCMTPVYIYMMEWKNKKLIFVALLLLTLYFIFIAGVTTCLIICLYMMTLALLMRKRKNPRSLLPFALITVVIFALFGFTLIDYAEPLFRDTTFESHFEGLKGYWGKEKVSDTAYEFDDRMDLYVYSLDTFLAHPFFGDVLGKNGGHNYFLDRLAKYGIVGMIPFFAMIFNRFDVAYKYIPKKTIVTFSICVIGFFALGFLKNMSGIDYWTYMFVYIPCILKYQELTETQYSILK